MRPVSRTRAPGNDGSSQGRHGSGPYPRRVNLRWRDVAAATGLLGADGSVRATVFAEMSALAAASGAINLGQGFPDVDGPSSVVRAAQDALASGANQYPPGPGIPELRQAVAEHQRARYGLRLDPDREVLVTAGATEALAAAVLALAGPGDEVLTLEPFYDAYAADIALAGARHTTAPLRATPTGFRVDLDALEAAFTDRTRLCGPQGYVAVDHLCSVSGHLRSVPEEEGLAGRFDDLRCHRREVVDLADAFNLSEESVDEAEVAAGDAGDRGDGGGLSQVVFVRVLI